MNAPTLLIGLGGIGCKIVERVSNMTTPEERGNIAFAVFDTDINELRGIQERNSYIRTIQTSTKQTVGEYLQKNTYSRDTWFPVHAILNPKTLTEGAGQVRAISRLAFDSVISAGRMDPLHDAIQSLYKVEEDKIDQALRVVITGSLVGGTGSGLILPVALYVRNYLKTHFRQSANITRGFFILPEVFFEAIKGETERNTLKANAYAALRELDAFLMKADGTLHEKYKDSVVINFPKLAQNGYEEYDVSPYDFCFLFDAQNAEGGKLNSFAQYIDHAASCIYAQSIGPMNKRSNSSEDNTIRKLAKEQGRNRYAGAGVSMLIYPYADIRKMIALKWAKQCISKQWLNYDNLYKEMCKENEKMAESGVTVKEQSLSDFYINQLETDEKHDEPFAKAIYNTTGTYKNAISRKSDSWKDYVTAVLSKIKEDLEDESSEVYEKYEDVKEIVNNLSNDWNDFVEAWEALEEYRGMSYKYSEEVAHTIAYSLFKGSGSSTDKNQSFKLETHLTTSDGKFVHPNALRYILIKILELLKKHKLGVDSEAKDLRDYIEKFEENTFDDKSTKDVETVDDLPDRSKGSLLTRLRKKPSGEQEDMMKKFKDYLNKVSDYQVKNAQSKVLGKGISYFDSFISSIEKFYKSLDTNVNALDNAIAGLYKKYSDSKGATVRYVCASKEAFDKIISERPFTGSAIKLDSELSKSIYELILEHSLKDNNDKEKVNYHHFFTKIFDENIIGYFENLVQTDLDVDIIDAIEKEAELLCDIKENENIDERIRQYVIKTINDTRALACPFIETPLGESQDPINSCTFNLDLKPQNGDDSPKANLINKELMNYGGEPDEDIPKNTIMFYKSYYGLRANSLSKFAPPEKAETYNRTGGEYFKAYFGLIKGIYPVTHKSKEINPHIDCRWHLVSKMPDLDEDNQKRQEYEIYAAFFWALVKEYVYLEEDKKNKQRVYKLRNIQLGLESDELIVSNGTECDNLYEVLDAIAMYPILVDLILESIDIVKKYELDENKFFDDDSLYNKLNDYKLKEPGVGVSSEPSYSIFDLPMLMKKSSIPDVYYEESVIELLKVEIDEIVKYLSKFYATKDLPEELWKIIDKQFDKHLESLRKEAEINPFILKESLFEKTIDVITMALEKTGLMDKKNVIKTKVENLKEEIENLMDEMKN